MCIQAYVFFFHMHNQMLVRALQSQSPPYINIERFSIECRKNQNRSNHSARYHKGHGQNREPVNI